MCAIRDGIQSLKVGQSTWIFCKASDYKTLEMFQNVVAQTQDMQSCGDIHIVATTRERQTGGRWISGINVRVLLDATAIEQT